MKVLIFLLLASPLLIFPGNTAPRKLNGSELADIHGGFVSIHCDHCDCNLVAGTCKCTGCTIEL